MKKEEIILTVKEIIVDKIGLDKEEINDKSNLKYDLGFDDLDTIEVIMAIEVEYNITIPDSELDVIETFEQLIDLTYRRINK